MMKKIFCCSFVLVAFYCLGNGEEMDETIVSSHVPVKRLASDVDNGIIALALINPDGSPVVPEKMLRFRRDLCSHACYCSNGRKKRDTEEGGAAANSTAAGDGGSGAVSKRQTWDQSCQQECVCVPGNGGNNNNGCSNCGNNGNYNNNNNNRGGCGYCCNNCWGTGCNNCCNCG